MGEDGNEQAGRSPLTAASLSFLFPGLGQYAAGDRARGILVAIPGLVVLVGLVGFGVGTILGGGVKGGLELFLRPEVLLGIVAVDLVLLAYHLFGIADAWLVARRAALATGRRTGRAAVVGLAAILLVTTAAHGSVASLSLDTEDTLTSVFVGDGGDGDGSGSDQGGDWSIPDVSFEPDEEDTPSPGAASGSIAPSATVGATPTSSPTPSPTPSPVVPGWARDGRLNLLLVGSDAGTGRWMLRTDTMVVLSVDIATGRAAMFGIPRNIINVPLPDESAGAFPNGRFPRMLNALYVYASLHPAKFPGGDARGFRALTGAVQELVGVKLDAFVAVDLRGFVKLVDALGGLWIRVPERLEDFHYPKVDGSGPTHILIKAGCQRLSGGMALAYARSRHQDSDYGRMGRQQAVLLALRRQLDPLAVLERAPELLKIARDHIWTTIKVADLPGLADLASRVNAGAVRKVLFVPPRYPEYLDGAEIKQIRRVVRHVFDDANWTASSGGGGGSAGKACP